MYGLIKAKRNISMDLQSVCYPKVMYGLLYLIAFLRWIDQKKIGVHDLQIC